MSGDVSHAGSHSGRLPAARTATAVTAAETRWPAECPAASVALCAPPLVVDGDRRSPALVPGRSARCICGAIGSGWWRLPDGRTFAGSGGGAEPGTRTSEIAVTRPSGSSAPWSSKMSAPLHSKAQPWPGCSAMLRAAHQSIASAAGHAGSWVHTMAVHSGCEESAGSAPVARYCDLFPAGPGATSVLRSARGITGSGASAAWPCPGRRDP
jgi:hypothetical protein